MTEYEKLLALPQVIAHRAYFDELAELARAAVDAANKLPNPYDAEAQVDAVLDQLPPPAAVHPLWPVHSSALRSAATCTSRPRPG